MSVKLSNNATSTLSVNISADATNLSIQSADAGLFPHVVGDEWFPLTLYDATKREIVHATKRVGGVITVKRAQEGTNAYDWNVGTRIDLRLTKEVIEEIQQGSKDDYEALDEKITDIENSMLPKTGGTISGDLNVDGKLHGMSDAEIDGKLTANEIEANNAHFENLTATHISTPNLIKVGDAKFQADGNIEGDIWEEWGSKQAKQAIQSHLAQELAAFNHTTEVHVIEMLNSGTIPWPDWVTDNTPVYIMVWGGGGGGGHYNDAYAFGSGGGGGGCMMKWVKVGDFAGNHQVTIGGGGGVGQWGGTTNVGNLLSAGGGEGGYWPSGGGHGGAGGGFMAGGRNGGWSIFGGGGGGHTNVDIMGIPKRWAGYSLYGGGGGAGHPGEYGTSWLGLGGRGGDSLQNGHIPGGGGGYKAKGGQGKVILRILK